MPDCAMPPASPTTPATQNATPAVSVDAKLAAPAPRHRREKFYVQFLPRAPLAPVWPASFAVTPTASVSRFQEHCSLLI